MKSCLKTIPLIWLLVQCGPKPPMPPGAEAKTVVQNVRDGVNEKLYQVRSQSAGVNLENLTRIKEFSSPSEAAQAFEKTIPQRPKAQGDTGSLRWARSEYSLWMLRGNILTFVMFLPPDVMNWSELSPEQMKKAEKAMDEYCQQIIEK